MNRWLAGAAIGAMTAALSGCYVSPGYSYVRGGYGGDAYYGRATTVYDDGYAAYPYDYGYGGYYGYPGGVSVGVGTVWYGGGYRHRGYRDWPRGGYRGGGWHGDYHGGGYHGGHGWGGRGPGGWHGGGQSGGHSGGHDYHGGHDRH